ncbi:MAG: CHAT domain-containing protein, partial [Flavobacteriales bacterium]|nr:CHAT domain-containing protein [Flavobacteriales bacterium]
MNPRFLGILGCLVFLHSILHSQDNTAQRHDLIDSLYSLERYEEVLTLIEEQLDDITDTVWEDTLYTYCYPYARAYWKTQGVDEGVAAAERIIEHVKSQNDPEALLAAYSDLSWIHYETGRADLCLQVDSIAKELADRSDVPQHLKGRARTYLGFDHAMLGDYRKAGGYFKEAHDIFKEIEPRDSLIRQQLAESANGMAVASWHLGRTKDAEENYLKALEYIGESDDLILLSRKASTIGNLALMFEDLGNLIKSKEYYHENIRLSNLVIHRTDDPFLKDEMTMVRSRTYGNLASLYHSLGEYGTSKGYLELALKDRTSLFEPDDPKLHVIQLQFAEIEISKGNYPKAEELIKGYLDKCISNYGIHSEYSADALSDLARVYSLTERYKGADSLYTLALEGFKAVSDETSDPNVAEALMSRGEMKMRLQQSENARADFIQARDIYAVNVGSENRKVAAARNEIARTLLAEWRYQEAISELESSIGILSDRLPKDQDMVTQRRDPLPHLLPEALLLYAQAHRQSPDSSRSDQKALDHLQTAIQVLKANQTGLRDEESRLLMLGAQRDVFDSALDIAYELHTSSPDDTDIQDLLQLTESNKTIILKDRLSSIQSMSFAGVPDSLLEREHFLLQRISDTSMDHEAADELNDLETEYVSLLDQMKSDHPRYFELRYGDRPLDMQSVLDLITPDQSIIAYALSKDHIYITLIDHEGTHITRVPKGDLKRDIQMLHKGVTEHDMEGYTAAAYRLYERLIAPMREHIQKDELLIVPDDELYTLNFEILLDQDPGPQDYIKHLLIQDFTISYLLSLSTSIQFKGLDKRADRLALAMAPGFEDALKDAYLNSVSDSSQVDQGFLHQIQQPFAVKTAHALGGLLQAEVKVGEEANESEFKQHAAQYEVIHLGTHTEINNVSPLYSKLILSKSSSEDGYLHAYELYDMQLQAELAVLTACQTGVGQQESSEGVISLAHSFAYAGCPSIIMSLWDVDEQSTAIITE